MLDLPEVSEADKRSCSHAGLYGNSHGKDVVNKIRPRLFNQGEHVKTKDSDVKFDWPGRKYMTV